MFQVSGRAEWSYGLVILTIVASVAFMVGYKTYFASVAVWVLWTSACCRHDSQVGNMHSLGLQVRNARDVRRWWRM